MCKFQLPIGQLSWKKPQGHLPLRSLPESKPNPMDTPNKTFPLGVMITSGLMLLSCWMPWAIFSAKPHFSSQVPSEFLLGMPAMGPIEVTINGWNGSLTLLGVTSPNWVTACCAGVIAILSLVGFKGSVHVPGTIPLLLALYGLLHTGVVLVTMIGQSLGIGIILAFACFLFLSFLSFRTLRAQRVPVPKLARGVFPRSHSLNTTVLSPRYTSGICLHSRLPRILWEKDGVAKNDPQQTSGSSDFDPA